MDSEHPWILSPGMPGMQGLSPQPVLSVCLRPTTLRKEGTISLKQRAGLLAAYYKSGLGRRGQWWESQAWYSSAMTQTPGCVTFTCTALCFSHGTWEQGKEREQ